MQALIERLEYQQDGRLINKATSDYADKYTNNWGYRRVTWDRGKLGRVREYAHRLVWVMHNGDIPDGMMVDHINLDKSDNRIENLRLVNKSGNAQNAKWKGYCFDKRAGKWRAEIKLDGKVTWLGLHETASQARQAYLNAKRELHEFASETVLK